MTENYLVYNLASQALAAQDEIWTLSCGVGVRDSPEEVTRRWAIPKERNIGGWAFEAHPTVSPITPPIAIEPFDPEWFAPLGSWNANDKSPAVVLAGDNRSASNTTLANWAAVRGRSGKSAGKFYFEVEHLQLGGHGDPVVGIADLNRMPLADGDFIGIKASQFGIKSDQNAGNGITVDKTGGLGAGWLMAGAIVGVAVDLDARKVWIAHNNIWLALGNPGTGTGWFAHWDVPLVLHPATSVNFLGTADVVRYCGDASDQNFAPPAGFIAWDLE